MAKKYDFDKIVDRKGTSCLKYDFGMQRKGRTNLLPMWVADMDFPLPDEILADFHKRIDHGIFGYTDPDAEYYAALDRWFSVHYGYHIQPEWVTLGYGFSDEELEHIVTDEAKLWLDSGKIFGPATSQFERFNMACPRATVVKAFDQLKAAINVHC